MNLLYRCPIHPEIQQGAHLSDKHLHELLSSGEPITVFGLQCGDVWPLPPEEVENLRKALRYTQDVSETALWVIDCRTPECGTTHVAKVIGEHTGQPEYSLPVGVLGRIVFCETCMKEHKYELGDLKLKLVPSSSKSDAREWW